MCGRYSLAVDPRTLKERFGLRAGGPVIVSRYNIAPSQQAPVIAPGEGGGRRLELMRWGLVPSWAKDAAAGGRLINARAESAPERPAFRDSFSRRRCLVPADGFYEWDKRTRAPMRFTLKAGGPFAFAGLWDEWTGGPAGTLRTFTILTTAANSLVKAVHPRMPLILSPEAEGRWLDPKTPSRALAPMLAPFPADALEARPASLRLNSPENEGPGLLVPAPETQPGLFDG